MQIHIITGMNNIGTSNRLRPIQGGAKQRNISFFIVHHTNSEKLMPHTERS